MAFSVGQITATIGLDMTKFEKGMQRVRALGTKMTASITAPLLGVGALALKTSANYEQLRVSMDTLNGSAEEGARNFERLKKFSAETPFQLNDLAKAQNTLQGFSLEADTAFNSIEMIGDIAAVTGGDIQSIAVAFGQSAAEGKLFTRDIRQFINQGVPAVKLLADSMGVAENQVFDLAEQGKISFSDLQESFRMATAEGGMFQDGMKRQAQTLGGVFSTLKDNVSLALGALGDSLNKTFNITGLVTKLTSNIQSITKAFTSMSERTKKIIFTVAGLLTIGGPLMIAISAILPAIGAIGTAFAAIVSPIGLAVAAVAGLAAGVLYVWDNWQAIKERISDLTWWRNMTIDMLIMLNSFLRKAFDGFNTLLGMFGGGFANPFNAVQSGLESLKGETKEYETQFKSFWSAINNAVKSGTGVDLASIFSSGDGDGSGGGLAEGIGYASMKTKEFGLNVANMTAQTVPMVGHLQQKMIGLANAQAVATDIGNTFANSFGQGMSNVIVQGDRLIDVLENIGKLLLSSAIQKGLSILLSGGLKGGGFFGSGGGLIGNAISGIFGGGGGGGGALASPVAASGEMAMTRAFKSAMDQKMNELTPEAVWIMGEKGRLGI